MVDYRVILGECRSPARTLAVVGIAAGLLAGVTESAQAQFFGWWNSPAAEGAPESAMIPRAQIYGMLAGHGYRVSGGLQRNGGVYLADVVDRRGRSMRLVIDAYRGNILQRFATAPPRPTASIPQTQADLYPPRYPPYPGYSAYPAYPQAAEPPAPRAQPRAIPEGRRRTTLERRRSPTRRTRTATREIGAPPTGPSPSGHRLRGAVARPSGHPARTEGALPRRAADVVAPQPAARAEPTTAAVTRAPATPARKPVPPQTQGPGYANGVPINPLD